MLPTLPRRVLESDGEVPSAAPLLALRAACEERYSMDPTRLPHAPYALALRAPGERAAGGVTGGSVLPCPAHRSLLGERQR
jgi:hypothetical protein